MPLYNSKLVRGVSTPGTSERLATQADQTTAISYLNGIYSQAVYILGAFVSKIALCNKSDISGIVSAGVGRLPGNENFATRKLQTTPNNTAVIVIDSSAGTEFDIGAGYVDPRAHQMLEMSELVIGGFNYSGDAPFIIKLFLFAKDTSAYHEILSVPVEIGNATGAAVMFKHKWDTKVVANWDDDGRRYGYFEIINSVGTLSHSLYAHFPTNTFQDHNS